MELKRLADLFDYTRTIEKRMLIAVNAVDAHSLEAIAGAVAQLVRHDDWVVPAFREMGLYLAKGATLKELFMYFMGYEDG